MCYNIEHCLKHSINPTIVPQSTLEISKLHNTAHSSTSLWSIWSILFILKKWIVTILQPQVQNLHVFGHGSSLGSQTSCSLTTCHCPLLPSLALALPQSHPCTYAHCLHPHPHLKALLCHPVTIVLLPYHSADHCSTSPIILPKAVALLALCSAAPLLCLLHYSALPLHHFAPVTLPAPHSAAPLFCLPYHFACGMPCALLCHPVTLLCCPIALLCCPVALMLCSTIASFCCPPCALLYHPVALLCCQCCIVLLPCYSACPMLCCPHHSDHCSACSVYLALLCCPLLCLPHALLCCCIILLPLHALCSTPLLSSATALFCCPTLCQPHHSAHHHSPLPHALPAPLLCPLLFCCPITLLCCTVALPPQCSATPSLCLPCALPPHCSALLLHHSAACHSACPIAPCSYLQSVHLTPLRSSCLLPSLATLPSPL